MANIGSVKILLLYHRLAPLGSDPSQVFHGGAQKMTMRIAAHFQSAGAEVFFASDDRGANASLGFLRSHGVKHIYCSWAQSRKVLANVWNLIRTVRKHGIDVIHAHDRRSAMYAWIVSKWTGTPMIYTARNEFTDKVITRWFFGRNITSVSKAVKDNLVKNFGISSERVKVIYNGIELKRSTENERCEILDKYGLNANDRIVVVVARLSTQKGHRYLIDAIAEMSNGHSNLKVLLVGSGELRDDLMSQVEESGVKGEIIFCGSQDCVAAFYDISEFSILPSLWEGLPGSAIESLLLGKPVVASCVGGLPEIVEDKHTGLLVPPGDSAALARAILFMLEDPARTRDMGRQGQIVATEKFAPERMFREYQEYCTSIIAAESRRGATGG